MNATTYAWICYQCGERGNLSMLIQKMGGKGTNTVELLREVRHESVGRKTKEIELEEVVEAPDPILLYARYESFRWPPEWALHSRMINQSAAERYGVKWDKGWVLPLFAPRSSELWGWQFKRMDYVSNYPKSVKKSQTLFGLNELKASTVTLVESPLDVCRLSTMGVEAVASFGAMVSKVQLGLLIEAADKVVLALDSDKEGQRQTVKIYPWLARQLPTCTISFPLGVKDPGECTDQQIQQLFS